jgi:hypothetical protein
MDDRGLNCFPEGEISYCQKHRNDYFRKLNKYISSDENEEKAISLLKKYQQDVMMSIKRSKCSFHIGSC